MTYTIQTKILSVAGSQTWTVEADSEAEAIRKFMDGECKLESEQMEAVDVGEPIILK